MRKARFAPAALGALLTAGCVVPQHDEARETLDEKTGTTVLAMGAALEFYSPQPEVGLKAATFAYLGALEVNRMGERRLLLWLSILPGTQPGPQQAPAANEPIKLRIMADARQVVPPLVEAGAQGLGLSRAPFKRPAEWAYDRYFDVTIDELRALESAASLALEIASGDGQVQRFDLWTPDRTGLARFIERVSSG
jgi:hypothetical protein